MMNATRYAHTYGHIPFSEMPFNDGDCLTLCGLFYEPLERVAPHDFTKTMTLGEISSRFYAANGYRHRAAGLLFPPGISRRLVDLQVRRRFSGLRVTGCEAVLDKEKTTQFAAITVLLPDGTLFVIFRGTDDSFAGWKEDLHIMRFREIRSDALAADYLQRVAAAFPGNLMVAGHSKGGHSALYAAMHCSQEVRDRITRVYNLEGPGFMTRTVYEAPAYRQLLPGYRHYVPQSSFIGMLLAPDDDYAVIKSRRKLGLLQHDPNTWLLEEGNAVLLPSLDFAGRVTKKSLVRLLEEASEAMQENFYTVVTTVAENSGQDSLLGLAKNLHTAVPKMAAAWNTLDPAVRRQFIRSNLEFLQIVRESIREEIKQPASAPPVSSAVPV